MSRPLKAETGVRIPLGATSSRALVVILQGVLERPNRRTLQAVRLLLTDASYLPIVPTSGPRVQPSGEVVTLLVSPWPAEVAVLSPEIVTHKAFAVFRSRRLAPFDRRAGYWRGTGVPPRGSDASRGAGQHPGRRQLHEDESGSAEPFQEAERFRRRRDQDAEDDKSSQTRGTAVVAEARQARHVNAEERQCDNRKHRGNHVLPTNRPTTARIIASASRRMAAIDPRSDPGRPILGAGTPASSHCSNTRGQSVD
jgi:hypothetical protein